MYQVAVKRGVRVPSEDGEEHAHEGQDVAHVALRLVAQLTDGFGSREDRPAQPLRCREKQVCDQPGKERPESDPARGFDDVVAHNGTEARRLIEATPLGSIDGVCLHG